MGKRTRETNWACWQQQKYSVVHFNGIFRHSKTEKQNAILTPARLSSLKKFHHRWKWIRVWAHLTHINVCVRQIGYRYRIKYILWPWATSNKPTGIYFFYVLSTTVKWYRCNMISLKANKSKCDMKRRLDFLHTYSKDNKSFLLFGKAISLSELSFSIICNFSYSMNNRTIISYFKSCYEFLRSPDIYN